VIGSGLGPRSPLPNNSLKNNLCIEIHQLRERHSGGGGASQKNPDDLFEGQTFPTPCHHVPATVTARTSWLTYILHIILKYRLPCPQQQFASAGTVFKGKLRQITVTNKGSSKAVQVGGTLLANRDYRRSYASPSLPVVHLSISDSLSWLSSGHVLMFQAWLSSGHVLMFQS
jgi:hypothetical protein